VAPVGSTYGLGGCPRFTAHTLCHTSKVMQRACIGCERFVPLSALRAIGEKLFANSGKKRYNEFEVKKDVKH